MYMADCLDRVLLQGGGGTPTELVNVGQYESLVAKTAAWVRLSRPSLFSMLDT
jgi:hypothetical protein